MTHSSIAVMEVGGERSYVYCGTGGVVGVSAKDGHSLWETTDWKISIATVPSPTILEDGRLFLSGGYNAGSLMLEVQTADGRFTVKTLFRLDPEVFGATQQTPIYYEQHLYGVRPDGQLACLGADGKVVWTSGPSQVFGLGSYLLANGLLFVLNDTGTLSLVEASPEKYSRLAQAQVLKGRESWAPMALAGDRLIARDLTRMVCLRL
jgi:outer membrane protein assembly factor BamB